MVYQRERDKGQSRSRAVGILLCEPRAEREAVRELSSAPVLRPALHLKNFHLPALHFLPSSAAEIKTSPPDLF